MKRTCIFIPVLNQKKGYIFDLNHVGISDEFRQDVLNNLLYLNTKYKWRIVI